MPLHLLSTVDTADGHKLSLYERAGDFYISLDGQELMSSRAHDSETALAHRACAELPAAPGPVRVLIGGLGLGFTLQAALDVLPPNAEVHVSELFPTIVGWHRDHLGALGGAIEDSRTRIVEGDVATLISPGGGPWHAILLDVDNGPRAPCVERNRALYSQSGIERVHDSLVVGGVLGVWSTDDDPGYVDRLDRAGLDAWSETVNAHAGKGSKHTLFFARRR